MSKDLAKNFLKMQSRLEHDFMNYLQVISGYLQLGNLEKAKNYVQKAIEDLEMKAQLRRIPLPLLQNFLWEQMLLGTKLTVLNGQEDWMTWQKKEQELTSFLKELLTILREKLSSETWECTLGLDELTFAVKFMLQGPVAQLAVLQGEKLDLAGLAVSYQLESPMKLSITIK